MKEYDKRKSHKSSKLPVIYISSNNVRHSVTKTFVIPHYASPNFTTLSALHFLPFYLHQATPHYPLIWLNPI